VSADVLALLDELERARAEATPGPWRLSTEEAGEPYPGLLGYNARDEIVVAYTGLIPLEPHEEADARSDAALIVAAVNALPRLTAALRAVLELADEYERRGRLNADSSSLDSRVHQMAADRLRDTITAALSPEAVTQ
jgi:hypothetical protein